MDDQIRQVLRDLIRQYGPELAADPRRLRALLRDLCPGQQLPINLLVAAATENVPARLADETVPLAIRTGQQAERLMKTHGQTAENARWAVESWLAALEAARPAQQAPTDDDEPEPAAVPATPPVTPSRTNATPTTKDLPPPAPSTASAAAPPSPAVSPVQDEEDEQTSAVPKPAGKADWTPVSVVMLIFLMVAVVIWSLVAIQSPQTGHRASPRYQSPVGRPAGIDPSHFRISEIDGMPQVLIPAGKFVMGSTEEEDESPRRQLKISAFWMDQHEVTNDQYCRFLNARRPPKAECKQWVTLKGDDPIRSRDQISRRFGRYVPAPGTAHHPVVDVSWAGATAYAEWAGRALPTEAQWERAARGGQQTKYVWGDSDTPPSSTGNLLDETAVRAIPDWSVPDGYFEGYDDGYLTTSPVGSFQPNAFGLYDMEGNVSEWCRDLAAISWYAKMPFEDPCNDVDGSYRICRGGSFLGAPTEVRVANRTWRAPDNRFFCLGFRCAAPAQ